MAYRVKVFRDFNHCYNHKTGKTKKCKDCSTQQQGLCEARANQEYEPHHQLT